MFPLQEDSLPSDAAGLQGAMEASLRRLLTSANGQLVAVLDRHYPELEAIHVSLDGASTADLPPTFRLQSPETTPAVSADRFEISGKPVFIQGAAVELTCAARSLKLGQARDENGKVVLLLQDATDGQVEAAISVKDLEALVRSAASAAARKQGVILEDVQVQLKSTSDRSLDASVQVRARKLFLTAAVHLNGSVAIDEHLNARLSKLECYGEGTLGTLACGFLGPHLQRLDGREFSLLALPLGEVKLHDIRIALGDELRVTAKFGRPA